MYNGKSLSKSVFSRAGVVGSKKAQYAQKSFEKARQATRNDAFYGINRGLDKQLPELFVKHKDHVPVFDLHKYFAIANPQATNYVHEIMRQAADYMGAGFLYPWTALQFGVRNVQWSTTNNYHRLNREIAITPANFVQMMVDYPLIFPEEIKDRVEYLISDEAHPEAKALWRKMKESYNAGKPPPGGTGIASAWPEVYILRALRQGIPREEFVKGLLIEVQQAAQDGVRDILNEKQIEYKMRNIELEKAKQARFEKIRLIREQIAAESRKRHNIRTSTEAELDESEEAPKRKYRA